MKLVQPPARDYLPQRLDENTYPLAQIYAFFHHKTYDAGTTCFVPGIVVFDIAIAERVTLNRFTRRGTRERSVF